MISLSQRASNKLPINACVQMYKGNDEIGFLSTRPLKENELLVNINHLHKQAIPIEVGGITVTGFPLMIVGEPKYVKDVSDRYRSVYGEKKVLYIMFDRKAVKHTNYVDFPELSPSEYC